MLGLLLHAICSAHLAQLGSVQMCRLSHPGLQSKIFSVSRCLSYVPLWPIVFQERWPEHAILRSSIIYGPQCAAPVSRTLFLQFIESSLAAGKPTSFFSDEYRCPVYVQVQVTRPSPVCLNLFLYLLRIQSWAACRLLSLRVLHMQPHRRAV